MRYKLLFFLFLLIIPVTVSSQVGINYFPVDPGNIYEWRSLKANPSLGAFQNGAVEAGFKILHYGFLEDNSSAFKAGFFAVNLPRKMPFALSAGTTIQYFSSPFISETEINLLVSRHLFRIFSVGIGIGIHGISYNESNFELVDPDDPVFKSGTSVWQPVVSAGITVIPTENFIIAAGVNYANSPDISLSGAGVKLSPQIKVSVTFNLRGFSTSAESSLNNNIQTSGGSMQIHNMNAGLLQLGYNQDLFWMRGRLKILEPISIGYGFSMPTGEFSGMVSGNHELFAVYEFDKLEFVPKAISPRYHSTPNFNFQSSSIDLVPQFFGYSDITDLDVYEIQIKRKIDKSVDNNVLSKLTTADIVKADSSILEHSKKGAIKPIPGSNKLVEAEKLYTSEYLRSLSKLSKDLSRNSEEFVMLSPDHQKNRAFALGNFIQDSLSSLSDTLVIGLPVDNVEINEADTLIIKPYDYLDFVFPGKIPIMIYHIGQNIEDLYWNIVIEDSYGNEVFIYKAKGQPDSPVYWDGHNTNGLAVNAGYFHYYIRWTGRDGVDYESPRRTFYVRKYKRNITVDITKKYKTRNYKANKIGIILSK